MRSACAVAGTLDNARRVPSLRKLRGRDWLRSSRVYGEERRARSRMCSGYLSILGERRSWLFGRRFLDSFGMIETAATIEPVGVDI